MCALSVHVRTCTGLVSACVCTVAVQWQYSGSTVLVQQLWLWPVSRSHPGGKPLFCLVLLHRRPARACCTCTGLHPGLASAITVPQLACCDMGLGCRMLDRCIQVHKHG
jgi:hypothetical protein